MKKVFNDIQDFFSQEEEDDDLNGLSTYQHKTGADLFLVDAREKMFSSHFDEEKSSLLACLKCIRNAMRAKIFNGEKSYCGIILLGTHKKNNGLHLNNITVLQQLQLLGANHILTVDQIINDIESSKYQKSYGFSNFSLGDALWLSMYTFSERSQALNKRIILFTNDDSAITHEKNDYNRAMSSAHDMSKNFIAFDVIQIGRYFDTNKFYKKLLEVSHSEENYTIPGPVTNIKEMEKNVMSKIYSHTQITKIPFKIGDDFEISVSVHFLVRKTKTPFKVKLSKSSNERLNTKVQMFETETGSFVDEDNIIKSQVVGQKAINFNMSELKGISQCGRAELSLLGFKPSSVVRLENFVKPCAFIYPDEYYCKGSSVFFIALLKRCIAKQVVPICTLCLRTSSASRFVALMAQNETSNANGIDLPPGFIVFFLPFTEELRTFDDKPTNKASEEQVNLACQIIKKMKFKYKPELFPNPKLKAHWAGVEALALDLEEVEDVNDSTYPNYDLISSRLGGLGDDFMKAVYSEGYTPEETTYRRKYPNNSKPSISTANVEELIRAGEEDRLTGEVLRAYLKSVGQGKGLSKVKKSDLLSKVREHLDL
ncbi:hypothetical protein RUM43_002687 [Polyplax serrata]|uniref:Ku domain-containing protein n=1 Tax=Polyplax serrata TaxID=468196 RepID=A0AAN8P2I8_POLSC